MNIDLRNKTATIRRATIGQDANGQPTETWADYITDIPVHFFQASAFQRFASAKTTDFFTHQMMCEAIDITTSDRVVIDGLEYRVVAVNAPAFTTKTVVNLERSA